MIFILSLDTYFLQTFVPLKLDPMNSEWDSSCILSPDNFSNSPCKRLFTEMLSAFEYLLVFSLSLWDRLHCYYHAVVAEVHTCNTCSC